jgi:hypothetical protein
MQKENLDPQSGSFVAAPSTPSKFAQMSCESQGQIIGELLDIRQQLLLISHFATFRGNPMCLNLQLKLNDQLNRVHAVTELLKLSL